MNRKIYGESVQGASHIRNGVVCQDSYKKIEISHDILLIAVADGHGSKSCPYSKTGSQIAVNVFCRVMQDLIDNFKENPEILLTYLTEREIQRLRRQLTRCGRNGSGKHTETINVRNRSGKIAQLTRRQYINNMGLHCLD